MDVAHQQGLAVHVWTIEEESEMRELCELGVDGIITDRPTALVGVLDELGRHGVPGADRALGHVALPRRGRDPGPVDEPGSPWGTGGNDAERSGVGGGPHRPAIRGSPGGRQPRPQFGFLPWLAFFLARSLRLLVRFDTVRRC